MKHTRVTISRVFFLYLGLAFLFLAGPLLSAPTAPWQSTLAHEPPGNFPELRPLRAVYHFGWSGLTAAVAEAHLFHPSPDRYQLDGEGHTIGVARALWRYDVNYKTIDNAHNLAPIETNQDENIRAKKASTHLTFSPSGVTRIRSDGKSPATTKEFALPKPLSLSAAMFYLRSQPLKEQDVYRVLVYPTTSAYLATITISGREKISVHAGSYPAIKMDLQLSKVDKDLALRPHKKFRKATIWLSDDPDRIVLRVEAQIFLGTIFAELESVKFETARP